MVDTKCSFKLLTKNIDTRYLCVIEPMYDIGYKKELKFLLTFVVTISAVYIDVKEVAEI